MTGKASQLINKPGRLFRENVWAPHFRQDQAFLRPQQSTGCTIGKEGFLSGIDLSVMMNMLLWKKINVERWQQSWATNCWQRNTCLFCGFIPKPPWYFLPGNHTVFFLNLRQDFHKCLQVAKASTHLWIRKLKLNVKLPAVHVIDSLFNSSLV